MEDIVYEIYGTWNIWYIADTVHGIGYMGDMVRGRYGTWEI